MKICLIKTAGYLDEVYSNIINAEHATSTKSFHTHASFNHPIVSGSAAFYWELPRSRLTAASGYCASMTRLRASVKVENN